MATTLHFRKYNTNLYKTYHVPKYINIVFVDAIALLSFRYM